jgi:hypothetical protein
MEREHPASSQYAVNSARLLLDFSVNSSRWKLFQRFIHFGFRVLPTCHAVAFSLLILLASSPMKARAQNGIFKIPPVKIPLDVKGQPLAITAWATLTLSTQEHNLRILNLQLTGDLSDLQQNLTGLLRTELNKDDRCSDRIAIESASLTPLEPASQATIQLHFERWACIKLLGKQTTKRLIGGDAQIQIKLTPQISEDNTTLRLDPEIGQIHADGSLGELLRSGALGETIREKVKSAILSALQKGTNVGATLPPAVQGYVTLENAEFKDGGNGRLLVLLSGNARVTQEQVQMLAQQLKERIASR